MGFKYGDMDALSKKFSYPTFEECVTNNKEFLSQHPEYNELLDIAGHLSGRIKTVSCHAGGVGIVNTNTDDYMAMKLGSKGEHVIQVDKRIIEEIGIVKFDILGVQTLSLLREIQDDISLSDYDLSINNPEFENAQEPYEILCSADTNGVFQVESAGMKDLLIRLKPSNMEDLSAAIALYRPDTMGAMDEFIDNKHNPYKISYVHNDMKSILGNSYGCLIYQEQIMDIVRKFGGRSYGGADIYRKAVAKKNPELVKKESEKLYQEIINNGYSEGVAKQISDQLAELGGYCFNKSHSYCYAVLCFQTAFLKAKYPVYFFKALFNQNKDNTGDINKYIIDAKNFGVKVLPPNINKSDINFSVHNGKILFGFSAIKGIGENFAEQIVNERKQNGKYQSFEDFCNRVNPSTSQIINLAKAGAFPTKDKKDFLKKYLDSLYSPKEFKPVEKLPTRKTLVDKYSIDIDEYKAAEKDALAEVNRIKRIEFDLSEEKRRQTNLEKYAKYLDGEAFWEYETLGIFINDNPFEKAYEYISKKWNNAEIGEKCVMVGVISNVQKKKDKHKKTFAFVNIYSPFGLIEATLWNTQYAKYEQLIKKGMRVAVMCKKESDDKIVVSEMKSYEEWLTDRGISNGNL